MHILRHSRSLVVLFYLLDITVIQQLDQVQLNKDIYGAQVYLRSAPKPFDINSTDLDSVV